MESHVCYVGSHCTFTCWDCTFQLAYTISPFCGVFLIRSTHLTLAATCWNRYFQLDSMDLLMIALADDKCLRVYVCLRLCARFCPESTFQRTRDHPALHGHPCVIPHQKGLNPKQQFPSCLFPSSQPALQLGTSLSILPLFSRVG